MTKKARIGVVGLGVVGSGVVKLLQQNHDLYRNRLGFPVELALAADVNLERARELHLKPGQFVTDGFSLAKSQEVDILVETIGGTKPALDIILEGIRNGKHIVTSNKEVIAKHGEEIFDLAREKKVAVYIEATVGGGIPLILPLKRSLSANTITRIAGIVNGTTNYILTQMTQERRSYADVLAEAQRLGYAEKDPTADVEGHDARYKIAILSSIIFGERVRYEDVSCEGISRITPEDIAHGEKIGYVIKLLATARQEKGKLEVKVHPAFLPKNHPLASVNDVYNAVFVEGDAVGKTMFYGRGAGQMPTASAVMGDVLNIASELDHPPNRLMECIHGKGTAKLTPLEEIESRFYIRLKTRDVPGVMANIGSAFARHQVSIQSLVQEGEGEEFADITMISHRIKEKNFRAALREIEELEITRQICSVIRVEE